MSTGRRDMQWRLVPAVATREILDAFFKTMILRRPLSECWAAALAAAPEPAPAGEPLTFTYRNYRGEIALRRVQPLAIRFGSTEWHPEPQWLLRAFDLDKGEEREFAMRDIGAPPAGEPVAWVSQQDFGTGLRIVEAGWVADIGWSSAFPLYTTPPTVDTDAVRRAALEEAARELDNGAAASLARSETCSDDMVDEFCDRATYFTEAAAAILALAPQPAPPDQEAPHGPR